MTARLVPTVVASVLALGVACGPVAAGERPVTFNDFLDRLEVEVGVETGSLIVMPVLLRKNAPTNCVGPVHGGTVHWEPAAVTGKPDLVRLGGGRVDAAGLPTFVPPGTLLLGGGRERLLDRAVAVVPGGPCVVDSLVCDSRDAAAQPAPSRAAGPVAPLEQRKLALLSAESDTFNILQQVQALTAGLDKKSPTVGEILASKFAAGAATLRMKQLLRIPPAYGGTTVGHVAFFGFRPVEVVIFGDPASYRAHGPAFLSALAVSHALWNETVGMAGRGEPGTDLRDMKPSARAVLAGLAAARGRGVRRGRGEKTAWTTLGVKTSARGAPSFVGRVTTTSAGGFLFLQAVENGRDLVYPPPYPRPRGGDEFDPRKGGGGLGEKALLRMLQRIQENRAKARAEQGNR